MNSENGNSGFRARIQTLVGKEKPYLWAKRLGIPSASFDRIWREGTIPKAEHLVRIAKGCGVTIDWLVIGEPPQKKDGEPVSVASLDYQGSGNLDGELLGRLTEAVQALYREANQRIGLGQSVKIATTLYREIAEVPEDDRPGAMTLRLNQLRRELIAASTGATTGKSSA